jgi:hypothetical protein
MPRPLRRIPDGALAVGIALGVLVLQLPFRLHWVNLTDEGAILAEAADILAGRRLYVDVVHPAFPGVFFLTAAAFAIGGATFETARTLACLIFAGTTGVAYLVGRWWLRRAGALALVLLFVLYRVWAFPHWQMVSYSSLAIALLVGAMALVGAAFGSGRAGTYLAAGMVAALAMVTKQDSGVLGTAALGLGIMLAAPVPARDRIRPAVWFVAGATIVFAVALAAVVASGMLAGLIRHTIVAPLHGLRHFAYQGSPPLWPLFAQDADLRARAFSYFPSIAVDLSGRRSRAAGSIATRGGPTWRCGSRITSSGSCRSPRCRSSRDPRRRRTATPWCGGPASGSRSSSRSRHGSRSTARTTGSICSCCIRRRCSSCR